MSDANWVIVLLNIAAMFIVILIGWVARRKNYLSGETTSTLSKFVVDVTIPAMIFTSMLRTIDPDSLRSSWSMPLIGSAEILIGLLVGLLTFKFFSNKEKVPTFLFLIGVANWIYLPLPIAKALYGSEGERCVLLANVGATIVLWTIGIGILRRSKPDWESLRHLLINPGLIATVAGIILALVLPAARTLELAPIVGLPAAALGAKSVISALVMIGGLTIPLSLVVIGAQLGGLDLSDHRPSRTLTGVVISRLLIAPVVVGALILGMSALKVTLPTVPRMVTYLIASMPVAISCSIFTDRFGGDTSLAARGIFYTTLFSIVSVPVIFYLVQHFGL